jgi:glycosyltransferase involved in cell wall biosynthesis
MTDQPTLSIVVPIHNEAGSLTELHQRLQSVLSTLAGQYEILLVDDGSTDESVTVAESLVRGQPDTRLVELSRNFGKELAILAGYDHCRGTAVVVIDADLQTPPEIIPEMVEKWRDGAEIVDAVRLSTVGQNPLRRLASAGFYWLMGRLTSTRILPNAVDFRLLDEKVTREIRKCRERFRFNRGLVSWMGFRRAAVTFTAEQRSEGKSRWSTWRLIGHAMDAIFSFSSLPLRVAGIFGLVLSVLSLAYMVYLVVENLAAGLPIPGYATVAGGIFLLGGVQLLGIWLLGEYVGRLYDEVKGRPPYVVRRTLGPEAPSKEPGRRTGANS